MLRFQEKNSTLTCVSGLLELEQVTKCMYVQKLQHLCRKLCPYVTSDLVTVVDDAVNRNRNADMSQCSTKHVSRKPKLTSSLSQSIGNVWLPQMRIGDHCLVFTPTVGNIQLSCTVEEYTL